MGTIQTPCHLFYRNRLLEDIIAIEEGLSKPCTMPLTKVYSVKTNSRPEVLSLLNERSWMFQVMNMGDLKAVQKAEIPAHKIQLAGPGWTESFLESVFDYGEAHSFVLDSPHAAHLLLKCFEKHPPQKASILIRINENNSHFGLPPDCSKVEEIFCLFSSYKQLRMGLQIHKNLPGTPCAPVIENTVKDFSERLERLLKIARDLKVKIEFLNLGGGIDSPWVYRVPPKEMGDFHNPQLTNSIRNRLEKNEFKLSVLFESLVKELEKKLPSPIELQFELGRSIVSRALSTLISVTDIKNDLYSEKQIIITDGNTASLGLMHTSIYKINHLSNRIANKLIPSFLYGSLPHSGDWLAMNLDLPQASIGDKILIEHIGAYVLAYEANFGMPLFSIYDGESFIKYR
ncbi:MAG: hypothetical protein M9962_14735 [Oligoflexia bacterium]|nr:hypothetical protein [Oligoflexia bacterium]